MSNLNTDFNRNPYNDDFSESSDYYRILFRPRIPVQARELTQLQTILQKQIQRFGDHIFKDGSIVDGCHVSYKKNLEYVTVADNFYANSSLDITDINSTYLLVGNTSGVRAVVAATVSGFENTYPASNRFYIDYIYTGNTETKFVRGEYIAVYSADQVKLDTLNSGNYIDQIQVLDRLNVTGQGYGVSVSDGIIYQKGFFQRVEAQTVVVKEFDTDPSGYRVGFDTIEEIVTEDTDESLLDNALGYPNYNSPGAHRLKLTPVLVAKTRNDAANSTNFFAIVEFDGNKPTEQNTNAAYNQLGDEMAKRTFEESGDYSIKPFTIETFPGIDSNTTLEDANLFAYSVSSGINYVKGYRVEKIGTSNVVVQRAYSTKAAEAVIVTANYGSYVIVDELVGHFDFVNGQEVTLYNAAQDTITDLEKASGARAGSIVGYATIRALEYYSGTKGLPTCQYLMYLTNIRMNSGSSFSNNVRSVYATGTYGAARADIVLSTNRYANGSTFSEAKLYDAGRKTLLWNVGLPSLQSLMDNSGATDTQFSFVDVNDLTLQTNGYISASILPASPGGPEKINASGVLTSLGEKLKFDVIALSDIVTANLTGTVAISSTTSNVVGTGTSFTTQYSAGDYIKVFHQSGSDTKRVVSVTNGTHLVIASNSSVSNASANYAEVFIEGSHLDLSSASANVVVTSNTTFTISLGQNVSATSDVLVTYPILKYNAYPMTKVVNKDCLVKIDMSTGGTRGPWCLGLPDVYSIEAVYLGTTYSDTNPDRKAWFELDTGQREDSYELSRLVIKPAYADKVSSATRLLVKLNHFTANTSAGISYFCVDSYPTSNAANSSTISWGQIPTYRSSRGDFYDLRNCIDTRPYRVATGNSTSNASLATVNPANATLNTYSSATVFHPFKPDSNFQADLSYYLPRKDVVVVNKSGDFSVVTGEPSDTPTSPLVAADVTIIGRADVPAWPTLSQREAEALNRYDLKINTEIETNRGYTMRDIGVLDQRLKRIEYYTVLNAVEQKAKDFTVSDSNGLDRFKNGIFADPFNSHALGKVSDFEYKIAVDVDRGIGRPFFEKKRVDFVYSEASDAQRTGNYVTVPYSHEEFIVQRFASKYRNCTESVWSWQGKMTLYPAYDDARDETRAPNVNIKLDLTKSWDQFASSSFGTSYGDWRTSGTTTKNTSNSSGTTTTTKSTQNQIIDKIKVDTIVSKDRIGTFVKDVSIEPYMRSRVVSFVATNMKPNTVVHAFFDNVNVDEYCARGEYSDNTSAEKGKENKIIRRIGQFGNELKSDSTGTVIGVFKIPENKFRTGDRIFMLIDVANLERGEDASLTKAEARFSASNISITTQGVTLTTLEPEINIVSKTKSKTVVTSNFTPRPTDPPDTTDEPNHEFGGGGDAADPIAQSFSIVVPTTESGMFVTKLDVYFRSKDQKLGVTCFITETAVGLPDSTKIVASSFLTSSEVNISADASSKTTFVFRQPVLLTAGATYAFLIKPAGNSPEYKIWMGETGGFDVLTGEQIYSNPYSGVAYVSANMNTWTPLQKEDIKFTIYRANFTTGSYDADFTNDDDDYITFSGLIRASSNLNIETGDLVFTSNSANLNQVFTSNSSPSGVVQYIDETGEVIHLDSSSGTWTAGLTMSVHRPDSTGNLSSIGANTLVASMTVDSVDDLDYHAFVPRFTVLSPARTQVRMQYKGTSNTGVLDSEWTSVINDLEQEFFDTTRVFRSFSREGGIKSSLVTATLTTESPYVSPILDLRRKAGFGIENLINNDSSSEANTRYGAALSKYVSQNVVLDAGQEAEDIIVWVASYRPAGTDVEVYVKFHNGEDGEVFDDKAWTKLVNNDASAYSATGNYDDYREFKYTMPTTATASNPYGAVLNTSTGIMSYSNSGGATYFGYKTFSIKIVLLSDNPAKVPHLNDVRALALQA